MIFNLLRSYQELHTDGQLFVDGTKIGETLEDVGRPNGVKIPMETCIPEGVYHAKVTYSNKFKRNMVVLFNIKDDHSVNRFGVKFTGIRVHGGNNVEHTAGCIIAAKHTDLKGRVWDSIEDKVTSLVSAAEANNEPCVWVVAENLA